MATYGYSQEVQLFNKENSTIPEDDLLSIAIDGQGNKWIGSAQSAFWFSTENPIPRFLI